MKNFFYYLTLYPCWTRLFLFLVGGGLAFWLGYQMDIKKLHIKTIKIQQEYAANSKELQENSQPKSLTQKENALENEPLYLPALSSVEILSLLTYISDVGRKKHLQLRLIEPIAVINQSTFVVQPVRVQAECQYAQLIQFMRQLNNSPYLFWIKDIALEKSQQMVLVNFLIEFYFKKA